MLIATNAIQRGHASARGRAITHPQPPGSAPVHAKDSLEVHPGARPGTPGNVESQARQSSYSAEEAPCCGSSSSCRGLWRRLFGRPSKVQTTQVRHPGRGQLTADQLNIYRQAFNKEDNKTWILAPSFSLVTSEGREQSWATAPIRRSDLTPYLQRWFRADESEPAPYSRSLLEEDPVRGLLLRRDALLSSGVERLVLPLNLGGGHWTSIHIDLKTRMIEYYDSTGKGARSWHPLLRARLEQVQSWMSSIDKGTLYRISGSETTGSSPSVIDSRQQWDGVSCGYYIPHYAALRGQGYSVDAINDMSRRDILRQIASRRKLVSECLQSFASA